MPLAGVADLKVSKCAASSRGTFKSKPLERSCARRFGVEENFSQAFFCHCLGRGKFQAKLFFAMVSGNAAGVGDVGGAMSASACVGTWQAVGSDSASERCG